MNRIVTLTLNPAVDKSTDIPQVVANRKLRCSEPRYEPGGGGINVSRAIRRLGGRSMAIYPAGGPEGDLLGKLLEGEGINYKAIRINGRTRQNLMVLEQSTGRQFRFGMPGARLSEDEFQRCIDTVFSLSPAPEFVVISGSSPPGVPADRYEDIARQARERGLKIIADMSGDALRAIASAGVFFLKVNMRELKELVGKELADESEQEKAALRITEQSSNHALTVSLGAAGAILVHKGRIHRLRAPTVSIRSKVGAGDSMVAGIIHMLVQGGSLLEAVRFGVAAGAAAVMTEGTELCRREDTEMLYKKIISD